MNAMDQDNTKVADRRNDGIPFDLLFWPSDTARDAARFDFSLLFEHVILGLTLNALVFLLAAPRLVRLYRESHKATGNRLLSLKMVRRRILLCELDS